MNCLSVFNFFLLVRDRSGLMQHNKHLKWFHNYITFSISKDVQACRREQIGVFVCVKDKQWQSPKEDLSQHCKLSQTLL